MMSDLPVGSDEYRVLTVGQRVRHYRERTRKTRAVLGGLVGRSAEWVKALETGRLLPPQLPMMNRLAITLKVPVGDLLGEPQMPAEILSGPGHAALPAVRDALNRYPVVPDGPPQSLAHLRARLDAAWRARHAAPDHRTVLGALLPDLIRDAQVAVRQYAGDERRQALALVARVLGLSQFYLAYQLPAADLLWRAADRAMLAAQESDDMYAVASAIWSMAQAHRDSGDWDTAIAVNLDTLRAMDACVAEADDELLALYGALQFEAAYTAARAGEAGRAWHYLDTAERIAQRLPDGYFQQQTGFGRAVMGAHSVTVAVELQKGGEAGRQARRADVDAIPSRPRRARHLIEVARGEHLQRDTAATLSTLNAAYHVAPETIRYNGLCQANHAGTAGRAAIGTS
jgi:transcriptional regulator with XRE-family HTH domain